MGNCHNCIGILVTTLTSRQSDIESNETSRHSTIRQAAKRHSACIHSYFKTSSPTVLDIPTSSFNHLHRISVISLPVCSINQTKVKMFIRFTNFKIDFTERAKIVRSSCYNNSIINLQ